MATYGTPAGWWPKTPLPSREGLPEGRSARAPAPHPALSPRGRGVADRLGAGYEYDPYGQIVGPDTNSDGKFDRHDDPGFYAAVNRFRRSTKVFDPKTGSPRRISPAADLSDFGKRYYSAVLGRWINRDPIGEPGGANMYAYVTNNPTNRVDYLGMMWIPCPAGQHCGGAWPPDSSQIPLAVRKT